MPFVDTKELIKSVSMELDPPGWDVVVCTLREAWSVCIAFDSETDESTPIVSWIQGSKGMHRFTSVIKH